MTTGRSSDVVVSTLLSHSKIGGSSLTGAAPATWVLLEGKADGQERWPLCSLLCRHVKENMAVITVFQLPLWHGKLS